MVVTVDIMVGGGQVMIRWWLGGAHVVMTVDVMVGGGQVLIRWRLGGGQGVIMWWSLVL